MKCAIVAGKIHWHTKYQLSTRKRHYAQSARQAKCRAANMPADVPRLAGLLRCKINESCPSRPGKNAEEISSVIIMCNARRIHSALKLASAKAANNKAVLNTTLLPIGISYTKITPRTSTKEGALGGML
jgi:hypothetical protein